MRPIRRTLKSTVGAIMALAASACSGGGGGSSPGYSPPTPVVVTRSFPAGVAVAAGGGTAWDIVGVTTTLTGQFHAAGGNLYDTLRVDVTFAQNIANALPTPGRSLLSLTQLGVAIGLDTDGNPNTGYFQSCDTSNPQLPFEYTSDAGVDGRLSDGNYSILGPGGPIYSGSPNPGAEAQTSVAGNTFSQIFLLGAIGVAAGNKVPKIGIIAASANGAQGQAPSGGQTDCVPTAYTEIVTDGS